MKCLARESHFVAVVVGLLLASLAPAARADGAGLFAARSATMTMPVRAAGAMRPRTLAVETIADPVSLAPLDSVTHGVTAASPGAGDEFYVDWVSPLQAPRGPAAADLGYVDSAFSDLDPMEAFAVATDPNAPPLSIPEGSTLALLGVALLPLTGLLRRRR